MGLFRQISDRIIVCTAVSKTFNLAGLNASCLIIPDRTLMRRIRSGQRKALISEPNTLACAAVEAAYNNGDRWADELCGYLYSNSKLVRDFCVEYMPGVKLMQHEGTYLMWMDFSCFNMSSAEITHLLAKDHGVGVSDGAQYRPENGCYIRLNIACPTAVLKEGLIAIAAFYKHFC